jgi:hypothetical protein
LKNKIKQLEKDLTDVSKEAAKYKEILSIIDALVMDLDGEKLINRLFNWKSIIKPFKNALKKDEKTKENS